MTFKPLSKRLRLTCKINLFTWKFRMAFMTQSSTVSIELQYSIQIKRTQFPHDIANRMVRTALLCLLNHSLCLSYVMVKICLKKCQLNYFKPGQTRMRVDEYANSRSRLAWTSHAHSSTLNVLKFSTTVGESFLCDVFRFLFILTKAFSTEKYWKGARSRDGLERFRATGGFMGHSRERNWHRNEGFIPFMVVFTG